jgi:S1-C subfamily serine protease
LFASDFDDKVVVMGVADKGPAGRSGIQSGDVILAVNGDAVSSLAEFYRKVWSLGVAGVDVPLTVSHEGITFDVVLASTDRAKLLKAPRLH